MTEPLAYRMPDAAKASGIPRTALYEAISAGCLKARKHGNRTLILRRDLEAFLESLSIAQLGGSHE